MTAECVRRFLDKEAGVIREKGERFEATQERLDAINSTRYGQLAVAVEEPKEKPARRRTKKAEE